MKKSFIQQENSLHQQTGLKFKEENTRSYVLHLPLYGAETWTLRESGWEIPGKF